MIQSAIEIEVLEPVGWIWLNRPDLHNAFDASLIDELIAAFDELNRNSRVRVIVLGGRGASFSAGAQVQWMKQQGAASFQDNVAGARRLAQLFQTIAGSPKPTVARVHGAAIGGGVGLVTACDIALGSSNAVFALSEVRLGLVPAVIAPYVVRAIGERQARRFFQTAERIDAATSAEIGLLHEVTPPEQLDGLVKKIIDALLAGAPQAQADAKDLINAVAGQPLTTALFEDTAQRIAARRAHPEATEGLSAFLQKRAAAWVPPT